MTRFGYVFFQIIVTGVVVRQMLRAIGRGPGFFQPDVGRILRGLALFTGVVGLVLASLAAQPVLFPTLNQRLTYHHRFTEAVIQDRNVGGDPNRVTVEFSTPAGPAEATVDMKDSVYASATGRLSRVYIQYDPRHPAYAQPGDDDSMSFVHVRDVPLLATFGALDLIVSAVLAGLWLRLRSRSSGRPTRSRWWRYGPQPEQRNQPHNR